LIELPSRRKALKLLKAAGCQPNVVEHCKIVTQVALEIATACQLKGIKVDRDLVEIGSLLHDIGRSKTHSINHAVVGVDIARAFGLPTAVLRIIERHIGAGITASEAKTLGLPPKDYRPRTLEEKIVAYADKLVEGNRKVPITTAIYRLSRELGSKHPAVKRLTKLHHEFASLLGDI
jgi:uncharacterized protein